MGRTEAKGGNRIELYARAETETRGYDLSALPHAPIKRRRSNETRGQRLQSATEACRWALITLG